MVVGDAWGVLGRLGRSGRTTSCREVAGASSARASPPQGPMSNWGKKCKIGAKNVKNGPGPITKTDDLYTSKKKWNYIVPRTMLLQNIRESLSFLLVLLRKQQICNITLRVWIFWRKSQITTVQNSSWKLYFLQNVFYDPKQPSRATQKLWRAF